MNAAFIRRLSTVFAITAVMISLFSAAALADELYARVRGTATDPSGAVIAGVTVKISNPAIGLSRQTTTNADGLFELINLSPGTYVISASKTGFATLTVPDLALQANQVFVLTLKMKVGGITEEVTVTANPTQVEQTSIQLGATISSTDLGSLPILNRNWINLQQTLPGVYSSDRFTNNFATNGSQSQQNSYLVNGTDSNDLPLNTPLILPSPDSIAEVRMITNTINPEYGRNSGAIMNAISKSGTNSFHGSAFENFRDTSLNVHDFFHLHPTVFHQNIYGGTVGGPIIKNKTFFFFSLQITRNRQPSPNGSGTSTVFNPATLAYGGAGNAPLSAFANLGACAGTGACLSSKSSPFAVTGSNGTVYPAGTPWKTIFANGTVPAADYNALSLNLIKQFVPQPNFTNNQFTFNPVRAVKGNQYLGRFDQNIGTKDAVWFYGFGENSKRTDDLSFATNANNGPTLAGFGDMADSHLKQFTAGWNHTFSTNILNEFRLGYTRLNFAAVIPQKIVQPSSVGFPDIVPNLSNAAGVPLMALTGYFTLGFSTNGPQPRKDQTYQVTDNLSWVKGRHSLKFGYEGRRFDVWNPFGAINNGNFSFDTSGTYSTGDPGLDFLLGIPASYGQGSGAIIIARAYEHYMYAQDQWRVRDNLTLTLGTGYQIDQPIKEYQFNSLARVCVIIGEQSKVFPTAPLGYVFPGDPGCNNAGGATTKWTHFGPRVGFAWSPSYGKLTGAPGKTSLRGGFGIYYNRSEEEQNLQDLGVPPFGISSTGISDAPVFGDPSWPNPWKDIATGATLANKFPFAGPTPGSTTLDFTQFEPLGFSLNTNALNRTVPYAMNYNLTFERELPSQTILRIGYVGSQGRKLVIIRNVNPITPAGLASCLATPACVGNPSFAVTHFPNNYLLPGDVWGSPGIQENAGSSNFNSLQITVEKRITHGLQIHGTYAWAHSLDNGSSYEGSAASGIGQETGDLKRNYGDSDFDARHRFVASWSYDVPNLNKLSMFSWLPSRVMGGWQLSGIYTYQTGFPITFSDTRNLSLNCSNFFSFYGCPDRPDVVSNPVVTDPHNANFTTTGVACTPGTAGCRSNYFFNPGAFVDNALGTEGTTRRGQVHGPNFSNVDFTLRKETKITEKTSITLGADAFNILNHTNFARPSGSRSSSNFGRVTAINGNPRLVQLVARFVF